MRGFGEASIRPQSSSEFRARIVVSCIIPVASVIERIVTGRPNWMSVHSIVNFRELIQLSIALVSWSRKVLSSMLSLSLSLTL